MTLPRRLILSTFAVLLLFSARQRAVRHPEQPPRKDELSFSEPWKIAVTHVTLDLAVDFNARRLRGSATLTLDNFTSTPTLVLDTDVLTISRVTSNGAALPFTVGAHTEIGSPLTISLPPGARTVTVEYETSSTASGLFWDTAAQSYGRVQPYLHTLNEPIGARSWIPIQDTPAQRMTYEATVHVPPGMLAVMSAGNNPRAPNETGVYSFAMTQTIPAYLIALGVARLEYHAFDERTGVYAEPELMTDAAWELQYLPATLAAAEKILGPFPFPRHDLLLMPPTFIAGGMEHPMLNFINPLLVVSGNHPAQPDPTVLIAHELAHSWAGDATTLSTWDDIWLNEGITSYLTLRIIEEMSGWERAEQQYFADRGSYENYVKSAPAAATILHTNTGFSSTAYTKGELFLRTLEDVFGRETFDAFLRDYFTRLSFHWSDDRSFIAILRQHVGSEGIDAARVNEWIYNPGVPPNIAVAPTSAIYQRTQARMNAFIATNTLDASGWTEFEKDYFVALLPSTVIRDRAAKIDAALGLSFRTTPPLRFMQHAPAYGPNDAAIERALMRGGPNNWIMPLYTALASTNLNRARQIFAVARDRYTASISAQVAKLLGVNAALEPAA